MSAVLLYIAAIATVFMAGSHAVLGETRLVAPLYNEGRGVLSDPVMREVLRLAWHFTTALFLLAALILFLAAGQSGAVDKRIIIAIGVTFFISGLVDLIVTRAKHDAWGPLMVVGGIILMA